MQYIKKTTTLMYKNIICFFFLFLLLPEMNEMVLFTNPSARAGYDTRSSFKRSLTGLNSEFSFS